MGSGLSSSASIEVLIAEIFNSLYNGGAMGAVEKALAGQWAENRYFGKPCGLMDQLACAHGGIIAIDFEKPSAPELTPVDCTFADHGYSLCILDTGSSHADLTDDYASIPREMGCVAQYFDAGTLREVEVSEIHAHAEELRARCGDRALLRALHFYGEHERAGEMARALDFADIERYLELVRASASSSWRFLQNCIPSTGGEQGLALALGLSEELLGERGAARVHGGGFAGTAQIYVPKERIAGYRASIERVFGEGSLQELAVRPEGVIAL
jgi:galactokinase